MVSKFKRQKIPKLITYSSYRLLKWNLIGNAICDSGYIAYTYYISLPVCENENIVKFDSSTVTLNSIETYQIESDTDLTRTRITSSKPLSAFSGSDCAEIPQGIRYCDHLVEQVPPTVTWGLKFLVAYLEDIDLLVNVFVPEQQV